MQATLFRWILVALCIASVVVSIQIASGAYRSELSHWPDAPSHAINALMVRDYVATSLGINPLRYAENYYGHYPKVAIGIWPPAYYVIAAAWMLLFGASNQALLALSALTTTLLAALVVAFAFRVLGSWLAAAALGCMTVLLPEIQFGTTLFMLDVPVAAAQLAAAYALAWYFQSERTIHALVFGVIAALAFLVKGNALALGLLPPIMLVLTNKWHLLKKPGLYLALFVVALIGLPWQFLSMSFLRSSGLVAEFGPSQIWGMFVGYLKILGAGAGWPVAVAATSGFLLAVAPRIIARREIDDFVAAIVALLAATLVFHSIAPIPGPDSRYMTTAYACLVLLVGIAIKYLFNAAWLPTIARAYAGTAVALAIVIHFFLSTFSILPRPPLGFSTVATALSTGNLSQDVVLVSSDANGEGALIVEMAMRDYARPTRTIIRATKFLSDNRWSETTYRPRFASATDLRSFLESSPIQSVLVDYSAAVWPKERELLVAALSAEPTVWHVAFDIQPSPSSARHLTVYRRESVPNFGRQLVVPMPHTLGKDIDVPSSSRIR